MKKLFKVGCLGVLAVFLIIGALAAIGGKNTATSSTTQSQAVSAPKPQSQPTSVANAALPTNAPEATSKPAPTAEPQPTAAPAIGQDVRVGDVRWKVLSAENMGNVLESKNQFVKDLKTSGSFIRVRFEVENLSNDSLTYSGSAELKDNQGRKYNNSSDALFFIPEEEQSFLTNLNPNITKTFTEIYEVPASASDIKFYVGALKFIGNEEAVIDLGLK